MRRMDGRRRNEEPFQHLQDELLKQVKQQGGFGYVALVSLAASGDPQAAEAAHEMAWEQLHAAPWHSVHPVWRDAYSLSCLHLAASMDAAGKSQEALRVLDMGLIMGGCLLKDDLCSAISLLQPSTGPHKEGTVSEILNSKSNRPPVLLAETQQKSFVFYGGATQRTVAGQVDAFATRHPSDVISNLPDGSLNFTSVKKRALLTVEDFLCEFFVPGMPVIITNAMTHWPAVTKWRDMQYLKEVVGTRTVPVEIGEHYLASTWKQELMTIFELLERIETPQASPSQCAYLAQHPLFDQIPKLREDILIPDYCAATGGELQTINAWLGPAGTVTPLHHDPHHNLLSQVVGQKYIRLYPPDMSEGMYPFSESMLNNSSQVDLENPDYNQFPLAKDLPFLDCILKEGEMLYIPPKWWHYVRSLSLSFSVSFWWSIAND